MNKTIFRFGKGLTEGNLGMKDLLGGKGAGLAEMGALNLPVPPGVTITTEVCTAYQKTNAAGQAKLRNDLAKQVLKHYSDFIVPQFGYMPLVSVRSGARVSMPGMMDTILNVGITSKNMGEWVERLGARAATDSYRRLIQMYGEVVDGIPGELFAEILDRVKHDVGATFDADLTAEDLDVVCVGYKELYREVLDIDFPNTVEAQIAGCIGAVFDSWNTERAIEYRAAHNIPGDWGTAVNVQTMVFGNRNHQSATGVLFTRNPSTGEHVMFGEYLVNAQGEDVVAGIRTPEPLAKMAKWNKAAHATLLAYAVQMEEHSRDMQDMEFTIQDGEVFILQTRTGKRSAAAAFRVARELLDAGVITQDEALRRVTGKQYRALKRPTIEPTFKLPPAVVGLPAAGSVVTGVAVFTADAAKASKVPCVLVTKETTPEDFGGMMASVGILTATGGVTSHAAVVARGMDKTCIVGASKLVIGKTIKAGDKVTLDGATGRVWVNVDVPMAAPGLTEDAKYLMSLAQSTGAVTTLRVTVTPDDFSMIPESGYVVLDCRTLVEHRRARRHLRLLLTLLEERKNLSGILDFNAKTLEQHVADLEVLKFLGLPAAPAPVVEDFAEKGLHDGLCMLQWSKKLLSRWVVNVKQVNALDALLERGWRTVRLVADLKDLMACEGVADVDPALESRLSTEGVKLGDMIALLQAAGRKVERLPESVNDDALAFAILGK